MSSMFINAWNSIVAFLVMNRRARRDTSILQNIPDAPDTIYCIGNGPSLREQDISSLNGKFCLLSNRAYLLLDRFTPSYCATVITDADRIQELGPVLLKEKPDMPIYFSVNTLDQKSLNCLELLDKSCFIKPKIKPCRVGFLLGFRVDHRDGFSHDLSSCVYTGYSVIFTAIQLAAHFKAKRIVCLGIDMNFTGDPQKDNFMPGAPVNFVASYDVHNKGMFILARDELAKLGIELLDATPNGKVDVLEKVTLESLD